jgi:hypothetical protein
VSHDILVGGVAVFFAAALAGNVSGVMIAEAMRSRHPDTWAMLGRPSDFFGPLGFGNAARATRNYVLSGEFKGCSDKKLSLLCNIFRVAWVLGIAAWLVAVFDLMSGLI